MVQKFKSSYAFIKNSFSPLSVCEIFLIVRKGGNDLDLVFGKKLRKSGGLL
jgi:hypothetical protein